MEEHAAPEMINIQIKMKGIPETETILVEKYEKISRYLKKE